MRVVLTIAGSDSSGGAGVQADLKAIAACGAYGASALTAVTAQTPDAVHEAYELPTDLVRAQIDAAFEAFPVRAVKTGMLATAAIVETVSQALQVHAPEYFVLDPVMVSESGSALLTPEAVGALRDALIPQATLVTPNRHETRMLTGMDVESPRAAEPAARRLLELGCSAVLVKGGHFEHERGTDVLVTRRGVDVLRTDEVVSRNVHGTGCTLAAAIATRLARGDALLDAVRLAKSYVTEAIRDGMSWRSSTGPPDSFFYLRRPDAMRWIDKLVVRQPAAPREEHP